MRIDGTALTGRVPDRGPRPAQTPAAPSPGALGRVCFVGLENLPVLAPALGTHGIGGEQVQQTLLARALARRGVDVSMVVADYGQPDGAVIDGIALHRAHRLDAGLPVLRFVHPRLTGLWRALARADADTYYVSIAGPHLGIVAAFARLHGRRVVFRIASDADCDPRRLLVRLARDRWLYAWGLRHADVILAQTSAQALAMRAHYGLATRPAAMMVAPALRVRDFAGRDIDVLWVSNLLSLKRPMWALDLAERLPHLRLEMAGGPRPGEEALYEAVAARAARLPNVRFHGRVPFHQVAALYERARVLVNTSAIEGFPNAYLQAWRHGTPVVATFDPDGLVARERLGATAADVEGLAREVESLTGSASAWRAASARCLAYMAAHHDEEAVLRPYLQALAHPAARNGGAAVAAEPRP